MRHGLIFLIAAILGTVATWAWIPVATRLGLLDAPNPLIPQHRKPTAHIGGVAVAAAAYGAIVLRSIWPGAASLDLVSRGKAIVVLLAGASFLLLGMLDDLLRLSARSKFAAQLLITTLAVAAGLTYPFLGLRWLDAGIAVVLILTAVNAVNLTDVCDGLVAGLAGIALVWASMDQPDLGMWSMAAAGACLGFLVFNAPPARVFLGDAGSHWLGFMLMAAILTMRPTSPPILHAVRTAFLGGVFFFELGLLVVARARQDIPFWQGSPDHFALRLQAKGLSRRATVALAWGAGALLGGVAMWLPVLGTAARWGAVLAVFASGTVAFLILLLTMPPPTRETGPAHIQQRRLLWIHQNFVSARQAGNSRAVHLVAALLERGWAVDVVTTQAGYLDDPATRDSTPCRIEREGGLTIHRLRNRGGPQQRALSWLSFCVKALMYAGHFRRVDVVYASTPPLPQIAPAAVVSLVRRAPLVLEVRDLWPLFLERLRLVRSPLVSLVMEWIEAFAYRSARHCVIVSPAFAPYLSDMGVPREALTVAPTGIETPHLETGEGIEWRRQQGLDGGFLVLYAGSFNESYDVDRMLRAAELTAREVRIRWIFAGGGRGKDAVEMAARRLPHVRYLGGLDKDHLWAVLQAADTGIVSLGSEPIFQLVVPGKLFDYCAAEVPVICTVDGMPGAIVRASGAGVVVRDGSPERLAEAVVAMAALSDDARRSFGRNGHRWMQTWMPSARSARAIVGTIESVHERFGGQSQWAHLARAVPGAIWDVMTRRSSRAGDRLLVSDLPSRCEQSLRAWMDGSKEPAAKDGPLGIPALLTARSVRLL